MTNTKNKKWVGYTIGLSIFSGLVVSFWNWWKNYQSRQKEKPELDLTTSGILNPSQIIKKQLSQTRYKNLTKYVIAQAKHETGNYTSRLFRIANNLFGMGVAKVRPYTRSGTIEASEGLFSKYANLEQSVDDFLKWLEYNNAPVSFIDSSDYAKWLKEEGYYTDSFENYSAGLKYHVNG